MQIQNISGVACAVYHEGEYINFAVGEVKEVPEELGKSLLAQEGNWAEPKKVKGDKSNG